MPLISAASVDFAILDVPPRIELGLPHAEAEALVPVPQSAPLPCSEDAAEVMRANFARIFCAEASESDARSI